jgi:ADP-ribose pyrophosphatase
MNDIIPPSAQKVFSWVRFDVYQWQQKLYDGSFATFERARFRDGAFVIALLPDDHIIMTLQEQPARTWSFLSLPWGAFDTPTEDPLECAKRELLEETGYESDEWEPYEVFEGTSNVVVYTYFYIARNCRQASHQPGHDAWEKIQVFPLDYDAFLDLALDPRFHHWTLLPHLFRAKSDPLEYQRLQKKLLG